MNITSNTKNIVNISTELGSSPLTAQTKTLSEMAYLLLLSIDCLLLYFLYMRLKHWVVRVGCSQIPLQVRW